VARTLVHVRSEADVRRVVDHPELRPGAQVHPGRRQQRGADARPAAVVLKVEMRGRRLVQERADAWIVEAGAGEPGTTWWPGRWTRAGRGWRTWR
jgi:UDP-N-acetylmuramate dehydrogenase